MGTRGQDEMRWTQKHLLSPKCIKHPSPRYLKCRHEWDRKQVRANDTIEEPKIMIKQVRVDFGDTMMVAGSPQNKVCMAYWEGAIWDAYGSGNSGTWGSCNTLETKSGLTTKQTFLTMTEKELWSWIEWMFEYYSWTRLVGGAGKPMVKYIHSLDSKTQGMQVCLTSNRVRSKRRECLEKTL